jgi:GAF domain-containing protein
LQKALQTVTHLHLEDSILAKWQNIVDTMADLLQVPAGLVMRISGPDIEVLVASHSQGNPYTPGDKEELFGSGLYCETVIKTRHRLLVPNATVDEDWKSNPDIKLGMISYLGYPILLPDGEVFGTICVLDQQENHYSARYEQLLMQFKELIESHLALLASNEALERLNQELSERLTEIRALQSVVPICSFCKKLRNDDGYWQGVEAYLEKYAGVQVSHGLCLDCLKENYPEAYQANREKYDSLS